MKTEVKKYELAQKQGEDKLFTYYTLDNENANHRPHVHICVPIQDKKWVGSNFNNDKNIKTIASVFLPFEQLKNKEVFIVDNIEFETIYDSKINSIEYKQIICDWLNGKVTDDFGNTIINAIKCFNDYKMSNSNNCYYFEKLAK